MKPFLCAAALALAACGNVVATTAMQLANLSPLTADPADFAVRVTLPDGLDVAPNTAKLVFSGQETPTSQMVSDTFILERSGDVFRVAPEDLEALRAMQAKFNAWEAANSDDASGSLGVNIEPCGDPASLTLDARVSVAIQIEQDGGFLPLVRNAPLSSVVDQKDLDALASCP